MANAAPAPVENGTIKQGIVQMPVYIQSGVKESTRPARGRAGLRGEEEEFSYFTGKVILEMGAAPVTCTIELTADQISKGAPNPGDILVLRFSLDERTVTNPFRDFESLYAHLGKVIGPATKEQEDAFMGLHTVTLNAVKRVLAPRGALAIVPG